MFHTHQQMHKNYQGYVFWKDTEVEHFSFRDDNEEEAAANNLAARCQHLESLGIKPTTGTATWYYSWFAPLTKDAKYLDLLAQLPAMYQRDDTELLFILKKDECAIHWHRDQGVSIVAKPDTTFQTGPYSYHGLTQQGFQLLQAGQAEHLGPCYADGLSISAVLEQHAVPPTLLSFCKDAIAPFMSTEV